MFKKIARVMCGALKHEVLEEVGETSLVALFIFGTYVIPEVYRHDRQLGLMTDDDVEAVAQGRLGEPKASRRSSRSWGLGNC